MGWVFLSMVSSLGFGGRVIDILIYISFIPQCSFLLSMLHSCCNSSPGVLSYEGIFVPGQVVQIDVSGRGQALEIPIWPSSWHHSKASCFISQLTETSYPAVFSRWRTIFSKSFTMFENVPLLLFYM